MTIPLHKEDFLRLTPYRDSGDLTTFVIKPANGLEKLQLEAELSSPPFNAAILRPWLVTEAIDDFITSSMDGSMLAAAREAVTAVRSGDADDEQKALSTAIVEKASEYCKPYQDLLAQNARRLIYLPYVATRMLLVGWENREHEFETRYGRVTDKALDTLSQNDITIIGLNAFRFINLDEREKKAFILEQSSIAVRPTSKVEESAPTVAAGPSVRKNTRKTRSTS